MGTRIANIRAVGDECDADTVPLQLTDLSAKLSPESQAKH